MQKVQCHALQLFHCFMRKDVVSVLTARLGLLLFARSVHTVNDIFCNAEIRDLKCDQTFEKTLENKIHKYSEWKAILENKIAKFLKIAQPQKLRASKICTYTVHLCVCKL